MKFQNEDRIIWAEIYNDEWTGYTVQLHTGTVKYHDVGPAHNLCSVKGDDNRDHIVTDIHDARPISSLK